MRQISVKHEIKLFLTFKILLNSTTRPTDFLTTSYQTLYLDTNVMGYVDKSHHSIWCIILYCFSFTKSKNKSTIFDYVKESLPAEIGN